MLRPSAPASHAAGLSEPLSGLLSGLRPEGDPARPATTYAWVRAALDAGLLDLPLPGAGRTADRWAGLVQIGRVDLDVARLAEAHTDAVAICAELADGADAVLAPLAEGRRRLWGVWAANPPQAPLTATRTAQGWQVDGTKPWCSGAGCADAALVTAQADDGYRLFAVDLHDPSTQPVDGTWPALAMSGSDARSVQFTATAATPVGDVDAYLSRPGFWHGAVGVAAVWLGGAVAVAEPVWAAGRRRPLHAHALAHAGAVDAALSAARAVLDASAADIDADPADKSGDSERMARRVRAVVESTAVEVLDRVGRALGAAPLALDADHAKRVGDLQLYLRQSHAERDLEALGQLAVDASAGEEVPG
jgi:alkylation response protein AidB-like acyl-CoA dehydrogenase